MLESTEIILSQLNFRNEFTLQNITGKNVYLYTTKLALL